MKIAKATSREGRQMADKPVEGTIYQCSSNGKSPTGMSINGNKNAYGTIGADEHVTVYGEGWHRSWDNPGTKKDHSTDHKTKRITEH